MDARISALPVSAADTVPPIDMVSVRIRASMADRIRLVFLICL